MIVCFQSLYRLISISSNSVVLYRYTLRANKQHFATGMIVDNINLQNQWETNMH